MTSALLTLIVCALVIDGLYIIKELME